MEPPSSSESGYNSVSYNSNNSVAYSVAQQRLPAAEEIDDDHGPGVVIEHLGPPAGDHNSSAITVLSSDSRTLLLEEKPKLNGVSSAKPEAVSAVPKISSV